MVPGIDRFRGEGPELGNITPRNKTNAEKSRGKPGVHPARERSESDTRVPPKHPLATALASHLRVLP